MVISDQWNNEITWPNWRDLSQVNHDRKTELSIINVLWRRTLRMFTTLCQAVIVCKESFVWYLWLYILNIFTSSVLVFEGFDLKMYNTLASRQGLGFAWCYTKRGIQYLLWYKELSLISNWTGCRWTGKEKEVLRGVRRSKCSWI